MVERRFPRSFESLEAMYGFIREVLAHHGLDPESAYDLDLIAEELFTNMVKYGRGGKADIAMALGWNPPTFTMKLTDFDVDRFDPTSAPDVDTSVPLQDRHAGGLGIHLVRRMADDIQYRHENRDSTITITKRLGV